MSEIKPIFAEDLNHVLQHVSAWEDLRGAKIFITGGTGFFGTWLLESFLHANDILGLQASATVLSRDPEKFSRRLPHLKNRSDLHFVCGDVRALDKNILAGEKFSHVIHAATAASADFNQNAPLEMFDTILEGTRRVLDVAVQCGARRFLLTSSGAVYGVQPPELSHLPEEYSGAPDTMQTASAYGQGKRAAEWLCRVYQENYGLEIITARGFAFVGPHLPLDIHFAIGNFLRDAMRGQPIQIQGDGTPLRSYLYAADLVVWLWEILLRGIAGRAYNVGSDEVVSILHTAQIVASCFAPQPEILVAQKPAPGVLPPRYVPDIGRARAELNLLPRIGLREAVQRTTKFAAVKEQQRANGEP